MNKDEKVTIIINGWPYCVRTSGAYGWYWLHQVIREAFFLAGRGLTINEKNYEVYDKQGNRLDPFMIRMDRITEHTFIVNKPVGYGG